MADFRIAFNCHSYITAFLPVVYVNGRNNCVFFFFFFYNETLVNGVVKLKEDGSPSMRLKIILGIVAAIIRPF